MAKTEPVIFPSSHPSSPFPEPILQYYLSWETLPLSQTEKRHPEHLHLLHLLPAFNYQVLTPNISSFGPVISSTAIVLVQATYIFHLDHYGVISTTPQPLLTHCILHATPVSFLEPQRACIKSFIASRATLSLSLAHSVSLNLSIPQALPPEKC